MTHPEADAQRVRRYFRRTGPGVVCVSGGVDSTTLFAVAHEVWGGRMVALFWKNPSTPPWDTEDLLAVARARGWNLYIWEDGLPEEDGYWRNDGQRCYFCKRRLYSHARHLADRRSLPHVYDGTLPEDHAEPRPGLRAGRELGVRSPFAELGIPKARVRAIARSLGLPLHEKPQSPCLASRFPIGEPVRVELLPRIARAEQILREMGFPVVRVRVRGATAWIEVPPTDLPRLERQAWKQLLASLGWKAAAPRPYRPPALRANVLGKPGVIG